MDGLRFQASADALVSLLSGGGVGISNSGRELLADRGDHGFDLQNARDSRKSTQIARVRGGRLATFDQGLAALHRDVADLVQTS